MNKNDVLSLFGLFLFTPENTQNYKKPLVPAIKEADLHADMYQHQVLGTPDELKVFM